MADRLDRKSTRLNSSHSQISYAVFCLKKKNISHPASLGRMHNRVGSTDHSFPSTEWVSLSRSTRGYPDSNGQCLLCIIIFFFNDPATTEIYTLSLHDALPIFGQLREFGTSIDVIAPASFISLVIPRSEEHTSELQSQSNLVCRLLLEKKK